MKSLEGVDNGLKMIYANVIKPGMSKISTIYVHTYSFCFIVEKLQPKKLNAVEQHQLFLAFRAAMTNPNFRQTLQNFSKPESIQLLTETVPGLADDEVALSMLQDWELLLHLADPKIVQVLVEKHPALVDAASRMMNSVSENLVPDSNSHRRSNSAGWLARSLGADMEDDDGMDEDPPQQPSTSQARPPAGFSGITPAQLAAALNYAQNNIHRMFHLLIIIPRILIAKKKSLYSEPTSSAPQQQISPQVPQPLTPQPRNEPARSSGNNGLTPEMFTQALLQAMNQMGGAANSSTSAGSRSAAAASSAQPASTESRSEDVRLREQFDRFLPQMRELGITDDSLSLRALQATNGDIEAALNLIYAGLVDD